MAVHMVVLGVANLLRVAAELALGAPSGGFTGLPFVFAEGRAAPRELHREHLSLALALLIVGVPAWLAHFGLAQRWAREAPAAERSSVARATYLHLVLFVTGLLVFAYAFDATRKTLAAALLGGDAGRFPIFLFAPHEDTAAVRASRIAGAAAMALASAVTYAYHAWVSRRDRALVLFRGRATNLRRLQSYGVIVIALVIAASFAAQLVSLLWLPGRSEFALLSGIVFNLPPVLTGVVVWAWHWLAAERIARSTSYEGADERRSAIRAAAHYLIVLVSAIVSLGALAFALTRLIRRGVFGEPSTRFATPWDELQFPLAFVLVFGAVWILHWLLLEREARREPEAERQATVRRAYFALIAAVGLALLAVGAAGTLGVVGSHVVGQQTHSASETSAYLALVALGLAAWGFHWGLAQRRVWSASSPEAARAERRAQPRRLYLYAALLGGMLAVLVFGSTALFRLINATLGEGFGAATLHDLWHLLSDGGVGALVAAWHWRQVRADRAAVGAELAEERAIVVVVRRAEASEVRERLSGLPEVSIYETDVRGAAAATRGLGHER